MIKSYVAKTTINFVDFEFYIRPGDLLVHDSSNHNRLTVYRNGQIVKVVKQNPLGVIAFLKNKFIEEVTPVPVATLADVPPPLNEVAKAAPVPVEAPVPPTESKKPTPKSEVKEFKEVKVPSKIDHRKEEKVVDDEVATIAH